MWPGTVWPIRAAVPQFLETGSGDIVIVASVAGLRGAGDEAVYAATKFAQVGLAGGLDRELREKGVRVTTICPGGTATEFAMGAGRTPDMPGLDDMLRAEDVADAVVTALRQPSARCARSCGRCAASRKPTERGGDGVSGSWGVRRARETATIPRAMRRPLPRPWHRFRRGSHGPTT